MLFESCHKRHVLNWIFQSAVIKYILKYIWFPTRSNTHYIWTKTSVAVVCCNGKRKFLDSFHLIYHQGQSFNSSRLKQPKITNNLRVDLLRFRKERIAVRLRIEQMFHMFRIDKEHRTFVCFIWFENNDPTNFKMCVRLLRSFPSPFVATYSLHRCVEEKNPVTVRWNTIWLIKSRCYTFTE